MHHKGSVTSLFPHSVVIGKQIAYIAALSQAIVMSFSLGVNYLGRQRKTMIRELRDARSGPKFTSFRHR